MRTARARPSRGTCSQVLKPKVPVKRMVFHEITHEAIQRAADEHPRARPPPRRRAGDPPHPRPPLRLRGQPGAVAQGRAGPVGRPRAVRRDPPRRRARARAHRVRRAPATGTSTGDFAPDAASQPFTARLVAVDGARVATGRDFDDRGQLQTAEASSPSTRRRAPRSPPALAGAAFVRRARVETKPYTPPPGGAVHDLDAAAGGRAASCGCPSQADDARRAAALRERLHHLYAYRLARRCREQAIDRRAHARPRELYGAEYVPDSPARYASKVKNAQEAHEAIRPSGDRFRTPGAGRRASCRGDEFALYDLIWKRTVASQMADARGSTATVTPRRRHAADGARRAEFSRLRHRHHLPRLPRRLRGGPRRRGRGDAATTTPRRRRLPHAERSATPLAVVDARGRRATRRSPPAALHRGEPRQGARGARHRPPVDLRRDHLDDPRPRLRHHARPGARADLARVRRDAAARGALRRPRRLRLHRRDGGRPRPRSPAARQDRVAWLHALLLRRRTAPRRATACATSSTTSARSTPARSTRSRIGDGIVAARRPVRPVPRGCPRRRPGPRTAEAAAPRVNVPEDLAPDELTAAKARELLEAPPPATACSAPTPTTGREIVAKDGRYGPYVTEVARARATPQRPRTDKPKAQEGRQGQAAHGIAVQGHVARRRSTSTTRSGCSSLPRVVGADPETASRSPRRTAATART